MTFDPQAWANLGPDEVGPDAILTSPTATALYTNPIAIAQGAAGAPRVLPPAIGGGWFQMGPPLVVSTPVAQVDLAPAELDDPAYVAARVELRVRVVSNEVGLRMRVSSDGGATFSSTSNHYLRLQGAAVGGDSLATAGEWTLCDPVVDGTAANRWAQLRVDLHDLANGALQPHSMAARSTRRMTVQTGNFRLDHWTGVLSSLHSGLGARVNAWRIFAESGNIAELHAVFYGLRRGI